MTSVTHITTHNIIAYDIRRILHLLDPELQIARRPAARSVIVILMMIVFMLLLLIPIILLLILLIKLIICNNGNNDCPAPGRAVGP